MRRANIFGAAILRGEVVLIPWPSGYPLEGYFLPAPAVSNRAPAVICIGEPGQRKEEYLSKVARYASDRGMSLLAVDLLGAGASARFEDVVGRSDLEATIGQIMDYLIETRRCRRASNRNPRRWMEFFLCGAGNCVR